MSDQYWNYIVTFVGLIGFYLGGKKIWWSWYVNIANQALWLTFGLVTHQWGFVVGTFFYTPVFVRNAYLWTKEHQAENSPSKQMGQAMSLGFKINADTSQFGRSVLMTEAAFVGLEERLNRYGPTWLSWLPLRLRKRIFKKAPLTRDGKKIGEIKKAEMREDGLFVTSEIDPNSPEGRAVWEKIRGVSGFSLAKDTCGWCGHEIANRAETRGKHCAYCPNIIEEESKDA